MGWVGLAGWFLLTRAPVLGDPLAQAAVALGVILPVLMIWVAATTAMSIRLLRVEGKRLREEIEALRRAEAPPPGMDARIREIAAGQARIVAALGDATGADRALSAPSRPGPPERLRLSAPDMPPPPPSEDFLRAMDLPAEDNPDASHALSVVGRHPPSAELLAAARALAARLARNGIRVERVAASQADPQEWRDRAEAMAEDGAASHSPVSRNAGDDPELEAQVDRFLAALSPALLGFSKAATDGELRRFARTRVARLVTLCAPGSPG